MNVIEYIEAKPDYFKVFDETFDIVINSLHFMDRVGEGGSDFMYIEKTNVNSQIEAIMSLIVQDFVRYGEYAFNKESKKEIYQIVSVSLKEHYSETEFTTFKGSPSLNDLKQRYQNGDNFRRIHKNYDWNNEIELSEILNSKFFNEKVLVQHQLLTKWNDEDYLYETENYYVRFNWATGA